MPLKFKNPTKPKFEDGGFIGNLSKRWRNNSEVKRLIDSREAYINSPEYMKLLRNEFEPDLETYNTGSTSRLRYNSIQDLHKIRDERLNINSNIQYKSGRKEDNILSSLGALGSYTPSSNTIRYKRSKSGAPLRDIVTHEQSHALDTSTNTNNKIGGRGFTDRLYNIYERNNFITEPEAFRKWHNWEGDRITDNLTNNEELEFYKGNREPFLDMYDKKLKELDPFSNFPRLTATWTQHAEGNKTGRREKMYIDSRTNEVISENPKEYFEKNYPGLIENYENWKEELKDIRLYKDRYATGNDSDWYNLDWEEQNRITQRVRNNKYLNPKFTRQEELINNFNKERNRLINNEHKAQEELKYKDLVEKLQDSQVVFDMLHNSDYKDARQIFNFDKMRENYTKVTEEPPKDDNDLKYYYTPTEVRARLNSIREAAVELGYKRGDSFEGWINKIFESDRDNIIIKKQYDNLKDILELKDEDIEDLMLRFAQGQQQTPDQLPMARYGGRLRNNNMYPKA